jgi:hypothetical protein
VFLSFCFVPRSFTLCAPYTAAIFQSFSPAMPLGFNNPPFEALASSEPSTGSPTSNLHINSSHATRLEGQFSDRGNRGLDNTMKSGSSNDDIEAESRPPYIHV